MTADASPGPGGQRGRLLAELGLLLLVIIWGLNFVVVKWALAVFDPLGFNSLRHFVASLFLGVVVLIRSGPSLPERSEWPRVISLGVVGHFLYQMVFVFGLQRTQAGNASLMLALVPLFMLVFPGAPRERRVTVWLGALVSLIGVGLVSGTSLRIEGTDTLIGDFMLFWAAGLWAVYTMAAQPLVQRYGPIAPTAWSLWVGSIGLMLAGIPALLRQDWTVVDARAWGAVFYSSVLSTGVAQMLWYRGILVLGGPHTAVISNLAPLIALSAGALVLGEVLTPASMIGAVMVIGGVVLVRLRRG